MSQNAEHWTIAIGASAGGVATLIELVRQLPEEFPATLLFAWHFPAGKRSELAEILAKNTDVKVEAISSSSDVDCGVLFVPTTAGHIEVEGDHLEFYRKRWKDTKPQEINQLFFSVADFAESRAIGVLLTGLLDDGVQGLQEIRRRGGLCVVENPFEAEFRELPENALRKVAPDFCGSAEEIGQYLTQILRGESC